MMKMNKLINLIKTFFILWIVWIFGFYFYKMEYSPYPIKDSRLKEERKEASFLNLNESIISELKDREEYLNIQSVDSEEIWKEKLFEELNKKDYNF